MPAFVHRAFQHFLHWTEPRFQVDDPYLRRQAQILAALCIVIVFCFIPISLITPILNGTLNPTGLLLRLIGVGAGVVVYQLARGGRVKFAGLLFIVLTWSILYGVGLVGNTQDNLIGVLRTFDLLILVTLFARMVMSTRTTLIIMGSMLASLVFVPLLRPDITFSLITASILFNFSVGGVILVVITLYQYGEHTLSQTVQRKQRDFNMLLDNLPDYVVRVDPNMRYLYANVRALRDLKASIDELVGQPVLGFPPNLSDRVITSLKAWEENVKLVFESGKTVRREITIDRGSENVSTWLDFIFVPERSRRGNIRSVLVVGRDITEQKLADIQLQRERAFIKKITDTAPMMIYVYHRYKDGIGQMIYANPSMETFFGLPSGQWSSLTSPRFYELLHPDDHERWIEYLNEVVSKPGETINSIEIRMQRADGEYRWLRYWLTVFDATPNPDLGQLLGIVADVTHEKQIQAAVLESERARAELEATRTLSAMKTQMMIRVADQFRNPLAAVLTATDLLQTYHARMTEEGRRERFTQIRDQVGQLTKLLDDMNLVLRSGTHFPRHSHVYEHFDLDALAQQLIEINASKFDHVHTVDYAFNGKAHEIDGNSELIRIILSSLLHNAFLYTPPNGTIKLEIDIRERLMMRVCDTGIGLLKEDKARIFEPFYRGANIDERPGLGLGLSIVHDMVKAQNGKIEVEGEPNQGATFTIWLPYAPADATETQTVRAVSPPSDVSAGDIPSSVG